MNAATASKCIPIDQRHVDAKGRKWIITQVTGVDFDIYKHMPECVYEDGINYRKTGWNSDSGLVHYCETKVACLKSF